MCQLYSSVVCQCDISKNYNTSKFIFLRLAPICLSRAVIWETDSYNSIRGSASQHYSKVIYGLETKLFFFTNRPMEAESPTTRIEPMLWVTAPKIGVNHPINPAITENRLIKKLMAILI